MESLALGQIAPISFLVSSSPCSQDEHPGTGRDAEEPLQHNNNAGMSGQTHS